MRLKNLRSWGLPALLFKAMLPIVVAACLFGAIQSKAEQPFLLPANATSSSAAPELALHNLGDGAIPLDGPWQFHLGDNPAWAQPSFNDSHWEQLRTDKPWGEQNHLAYTGYAWYRRHINVEPASQSPSQASRDLALMVRHIDDAYEIYWNGQFIARNGQFPPHAVWYALSQPAQTFAWPSAQSGVLAIRVWNAPLTSEDSGLRGGFVSPPLVGTSKAIVAAKSELDYQWLRSRQFVFGEDMLYALAALLSLLAWLRYRRQWSLLWMSVFAFTSTTRELVFGFAPPLPIAWADAVASLLSSFRDISLWFLLLTLLRLRERRGLVWLTQFLAVVSVFAIVGDGLIVILWWTSSWIAQVQIADGVLTGLYILTAVWPLVLVGFVFSRRVRQNPASRIVAIVASLSGMLQVIQNVAPQGSRYTHWTLADKIALPLFTIDGNEISVVPLAGMMLLAAIVVAVYLDSQEARRRQIALEQELHSARELQQVLIPETHQTLPGLAVTSAYLPASEVGGDFFQIVPTERDRAGSTLVILGDVSGKGLKAAMSVALIVGAIRTLAESTSSPAEILAGVNRRVCGRLQGGFVTCLILRLDPDGACVAANAGHPPPFLNTQEMDMPGALPLGLISAITYDELRFRLQPHDHMTIYTDGLLEARNRSGELLGFDRMYQLLGAKPTAAEAARAAVDFGQDDDITVLTLTKL
jgi:hypothetical protein